MKKIILVFLLLTLFLTACGKPTIKPALKDLPEDYTLDAARADGCVIHEDLDITGGTDAWNDFLASAEAKKSAAVRLYFYDTLDPSLYTEEHYQELSKDYPKVDVWDLSYHKGVYTLTKRVGDEVISQEYAYLLRSEDESLFPSISGYSKRIVYFLSDTPDITWMQAVASTLPNTEGEPYRHERVYCDLIQSENE
ncbi:MAG: hypothetical protein IJW87_05930 [Clostridia bacterium]|nr:hypothetical protein [Clostridia bacterium]